MLCLDDDAHTLRTEFRRQTVCNLLREAFLNLRPASIEFDNPGELRQSQNTLAWKIADMRYPAEGQ